MNKKKKNSIKRKSNETPTTKLEHSDKIQYSNDTSGTNETASTSEAFSPQSAFSVAENAVPLNNEEASKLLPDANAIKTAKKKGTLRIVLGITLIAAVLLAGSAIIYQKIYYGSRWYKGTTIDGIDVSGQTLEESKAKLKEKYSDYALAIKGRENGSLTISGDEIDYQFDISADFDKLYETQHDHFKLFSAKNDYTLDFAISYDAAKLSDIVLQSDLVAGSDSYPITAPKAASVQYSKEKQQYICVEEIKGNKIIPDALLTAIDDCLRQARTNLDITDEKEYPDIYKTPKLTSNDDELQNALTLCNNAALRYITWNMGEGVKEQITPTEISKWITYKNGKIKYDNDAITDWVEGFCLKYKTVGKNRKIKAHNGKTVTIVGGDYGWQLDYEQTLAQAKKALKSSIDTSLTDAYIQNPSQENKKALTIKKKVIYANTAYQKDYENFTDDWDKQNYIEISIKAQKVYVIRKGKVAFSCRCITGRPVEGRSTPTGAFFIKEHREEYTLTGDDYSTPVKNWVRITWTGTGFHPATWQPWSRWTKDLYKTIGSHGCINLEPSDAEKIYKLTKYREAVFIY